MQEAQSDLQRYQLQLQKHRETLSSDLEKKDEQALKKFNDTMRQFTCRLLTETEQLLPPWIRNLTTAADENNKINLAVVALGSMAHKRMMSHSDMECMVLTERLTLFVDEYNAIMDDDQAYANLIENLFNDGKQESFSQP